MPFSTMDAVRIMGENAQMDKVEDALKRKERKEDLDNEILRITQKRMQPVNLNADAAELHSLLAEQKHMQKSRPPPTKVELDAKALRSLFYLKHRRANKGADEVRKETIEPSINNGNLRVTIVEIICALTNAQRQELAEIYRREYNDDLVVAINRTLNGELEDLVLALMETPARYDARQLHRAIAAKNSITGLSSKDSTLIEILCTRTSDDIRQIKREYRKIFGRYLEHDLTKTTWHHLMHLFMWLTTAVRDQSTTVDLKTAQEDASMLLNADDQFFTHDPAMYSLIFATQNYEQLRAVFDEYNKLSLARWSNMTIESIIDTTFDGDYKDALTTIIMAVNNTLPTYFANRLHQAMHGKGTHDTSLIRMIVTRSEIDIEKIASEYGRIYNSSLEKDIEEYCTEGFGDGLVYLTIRDIQFM